MPKWTRITYPLFILSILLAACSPSAAPTEAPYVTVVETVVVQSYVEGESVTVLEEPASESSSYTPPPATQAAEPPPDNYFDNYGINPFTDTGEDHLSTFAIDVDTASYNIAQGYLNNGQVPPADSVRVEEFINAIDGGYPTPAGVAFGIYADGSPGPFDYDGTHLLRIGIQGYEVSEWERKPANLTFVIDVSGSMDRENRLGLVKRSLQMLVERLRPEDRVAIVVYGSEARVALYPTSGAEHATILAAIYSLQPEGSTNAEAGLRLGYQVAASAFRDDGINRIVLCSDGVANVGKTSPTEILKTVSHEASRGITLTSVGFGMGNYNDVLMEQLADNGNGHYAYIDTLDQAHELFVENLTSTLQVIALDAKVQVDFNNDVVVRYRLVGYENRDVADNDFRNNAVDGGEIGAGHSVTALYAIQFWPEAEGRIATVSLRWQDPDTYQIREVNGNVNTWDLAPRFEQASAHFQFVVLMAEYAEILRHSPWATPSELRGIHNHSLRIQNLLDGNQDIYEFSEMVSKTFGLLGW
jgi:Ca-activated chloride channel family protein